MKKLLLAASAFIVILPDPALAQRHNGGGAQNAARPAPARPAPLQVRPNRPGRPGSGGPAIQPVRPPRPGPGGGHTRPPRPGTGGGQILPIRPGRPQPVRPPRPVRPQPPHRPGAGRPPHFRPIHGPVFRYPHGWAYRRWSIGVLLPTLFLSSTYYYDNWAPLGVGAPPPGYRWVRYGPDLLLVQIGTRRIVDVIYGAFY